MGHKTSLYQQHVAMGAKIVDFGGWDMPLHYGSQKEEHHQVRQHAGMFDVSHMTVVDIQGAGARDYLRHLLANDVERLTTQGKALYTPMLNSNGGVIDDLIVYLMTEPKVSSEWFRLVVNCATREKDLEWMSVQSQGFEVVLNERPEMALIAVQGPEAITKVKSLLSAAQAVKLDELSVFQGVALDSRFYARTGYTGEDGLEIMLPETEAEAFWVQLAEAGVRPCGLGARDTLRLEAGMNLYGSDMDEEVSPLAANMAWTLAWEPESREFIGRQAVAAVKQQGSPVKQVGLVLEKGGVLRAHQKVVTAVGEGEITSGGFSPTLGCSIALARVPKAAESEAQVELRGKLVDVRVVKPCFVRQGKSVIV